MAELSAYEQQRLDNIAENMRVLSTLGLSGTLAPAQAKKPKYCRKCNEVWSAAHRSTCSMRDDTRVDRVLRQQPKRAARSYAEDAGYEEEGGSAGDAGGPGGDKYNPNAEEEEEEGDSEAQRTNAGDDVDGPEEGLVDGPEEGLVEEHEEDSDSEDHAADSEDEESSSSSGSEDGEEGEGRCQRMELVEEDGAAETRALLTRARTLLGQGDAPPPDAPPPVDDAVKAIMRGAVHATLTAERRRHAVHGHASLGTPSVNTTAELPNKRALTRRGNYGGKAASCTCK